MLCFNNYKKGLWLGKSDMSETSPDKSIKRQVEDMHDSDLENPLWTVKDVAQYLQLKPETVRVMARKGKLPAFKVGRVWRFRQSSVKDIS